MYVRVRVTPSARKEKVTFEEPDTFVIAVREPAQKNMANKRVQALLAQHYALPFSAIRLVSGHTSPRKIFCIEKPEVS